MVEADALRMQVQLMISGKKLRDCDFIGKSDPACLLFEKRGSNWTLIGRTEQQKDNLNPVFTSAITIDYYFEKTQEVRFLMIDGDGDGEYDTIGSLETTVGALMGAKAQTFKGTLSHNGKSNTGQLIVLTEAVQMSNEQATFRLQWQNVDNLSPGCLCILGEAQEYRAELQKQVMG